MLLLYNNLVNQDLVFTDRKAQYEARQLKNKLDEEREERKKKYLENMKSQSAKNVVVSDTVAEEPPTENVTKESAEEPAKEPAKAAPIDTPVNGSANFY